MSWYLQDAKVVLAYAPKAQKQQGICRWPWAHALHSAALEGLQVTWSLLLVHAVEVCLHKSQRAKQANPALHSWS